MGSPTRRPGRFGRFGGRYVPEALWAPLEGLSRAFDAAVSDPDFLAEYDLLLDRRVGRPTPLSELERLSGEGATVLLKREDLCHGGSFCVNHALAQALLARRMGKTTLVSETCNGDFGVALGSVGVALGLDVRVFMGREDMQAEPVRVAHMRRLGVQVEQVDSPHRGRKAAAAVAVRTWMGLSSTALYCSSSLAAPDPFPRILEWSLGGIGAETRIKLDRRGVNPDYVICPVGSGSLAAGVFSAFAQAHETQLVGVQAGGDAAAGRQASSLLTGKPGVFQGTLSFVLQDAEGQILAPHSVACGLCVPIVGPQHAHWAREGSVMYVSISDREAVEAVELLAAREGIVVSLEAGHALAYALRLAETLNESSSIVVMATGGGEHDLARLERARRHLAGGEP